MPLGAARLVFESVAPFQEWSPARQSRTGLSFKIKDIKFGFKHLPYHLGKTKNHPILLVKSNHTILDSGF